jgi:hypothetical protein
MDAVGAIMANQMIFAGAGDGKAEIRETSISAIELRRSFLH